MKVAVLVVSRNRPDLVRSLAGWLKRSMTIDYDLIVVEAGTEESNLTEHTTLHYQDADFRGKCLAHNLALDHARQGPAEYDYYWVLMNDLVFDEGVDAARILIESMEREPRLAILSPTCKDRQYPASGRQDRSGWRAVTTCDYLGFMMRASAVEQVGFLNRDFRYCWGAIHELSYKLYAKGWLVAYSDDVEYEHLGGTTYGAKGTNTISREEYQVRAKRFAYTYFAETYGIDWPTAFWAVTRGNQIEVNTFEVHFHYWETAFEPHELGALRSANSILPPPQTTTMQADPTTTNSALRLHLGCGPARREGWTNVDVNPNFQPDIVASATELPMLGDASCAVIESCHLFEHLTLTQARAALREWRRLLVPGGELCLELPNLTRCMELVGTEMNGHDLGMISLFGYPPEVDEQGEPQLHKWGWTPESLAAELAAAGFEHVQQLPITQTERPAAKFKRDMRLVATVASVATVDQAATCSAPASERGDDMQGLHNVFAWPNYADAAELDKFFAVFARVLSGREDVCLRLRVDSELDGTQAAVVVALRASHDRILGTEQMLNVALLEGPLTPEEWREAGQHMLCRIRSNDERAPRDGARQMATPVVADAAALFTLVSGGSSCADSTESAPTENTTGVLIPPGVQPDPAVVERINALHPWFYPVEIDGMTVTPGLGSVCSPEWLANRAACRATLLVQEVLNHVDFRGRSVLDLACNCGFWSAHYALAGAKSLLGVEGRRQHVDQAKFYWERNQFLPSESFEFIEGNIADESGWQAIRSRGRVDVTLCAGILYHINNYADVLRWAAEITNEVMIIDTRVQDGVEETVTEPGDLTFNAIAATRDKVIPDRGRLLQVIRELGFDPQVMPVAFSRQLGVDDVDSYADGARITIVARKIPVPGSIAPATHGVHSETQGTVR